MDEERIQGHNKLFVEVCDLLINTRDVFKWPAVDERGFFWFIETRSWDGSERIGVWIDEKIIVFQYYLFNGHHGDGSGQVSMYDMRHLKNGGSVYTYKMLRRLPIELERIRQSATSMLSSF